MNILAVVPARAGSKGIPNKNIRIINGRPLVSYAISNALNSKYITDVIVTTDSVEVSIIATQMGAGCKWRSAELCGDAVTLDSVIADAVPNDKKWDYIITMQPTSPTLKTETLDAAIEFAVKNGCDTVISVVNEPHLSWKQENGKVIPDYEKRLNRQYLPPHYKETGAFVISKAAVVSPQTRIGEKVAVFEISEDEAVDIDSFDDFHKAMSVFNKPKVAIYVNGNNKRGLGHVYRALQLADEFLVKPDIIYDANQTSPELFGNTTHNLIPVDGEDKLLPLCMDKEYTLFINDILDTSKEYMQGLRAALPNARIVNFEDEGEGSHCADIVINALLSESGRENVFAGESFFIANKMFLFYNPQPIEDVVQNVFICFGGADPQNYTDRLLNIITKDAYGDYSAYNFKIALGKAKMNVAELLEYNRIPNIEVYYDVDNMPELMSSCDVAIASRGRTPYELAMLGIPSIVLAQNENESKHNFASNENGFINLGINPTDEIIEKSLRMLIHLAKESRQMYRDRMLSHNLRDGRKNVMRLINDF